MAILPHETMMCYSAAAHAFRTRQLANQGVLLHSWRPPLGWLRCGLLVGVWLLAVPPVAAQFPKLPGTAAAPAPPAKAAETPDELKQRLSESLADTRQQLSSLDSASPASLPEGITPTEVATRRSDLVRAAFNLERHLKMLDSAKLVSETAKEAQRREKEWRGFDQPPPYSFLFYDELRNQRESTHAKLQAFQSTSDLVERQISSQQDDFRKAEEANRRAADEAARAKGGPAEAAAVWRLDASACRLRAYGSALAYYQLGITGHQPRIAATAAELALIDRQLATIGEQVTFTDKDLATAVETTRTRVASVEKELATLSKLQTAVLTERDRARATIEKLRGKPDPAHAPQRPDPALDLAEARLRAAEAEAEALSFQMDVLGASMRLYSEVPDALNLRRKLFTTTDAELRQKAREELKLIGSRSRVWANFILNERSAVGATIREQESRLASLGEDDPRYPAEHKILSAQWRKSESVERLDQQVAGAVRALERWLEDDRRMLENRSLGERTADVLASGWGWLRKAAQFEVYRYDDSIEANGETITVKRGLTLAWLIGALLFFLAAYRLASWVSRRVQRAAVQHGWTGDAQARTLRRWTMVAIGLVLVLITLDLLEIPLTAFAFLGGAIAIGVGFGTQTLFKNFISGIIVLVERKVKVGDILDLEGIIGTVTAVDTRSSTLRGFDGVETLVPNSLLLENKVTNWTHSNARQRRVLRVGVAYGSPVQQVAEIMADCAVRHGLVLKDPPPLVLFEDFGADSLMFALYFWVELSERANANLVASDMRFMLVKRFADAGISIPFPQRDLHFSPGAPLKIELIPSAPPPDSPAPKPLTPALP